MSDKHAQEAAKATPLAAELATEFFNIREHNSTARQRLNSIMENLSQTVLTQTQTDMLRKVFCDREAEARPVPGDTAPMLQATYAARDAARDITERLSLLLEVLSSPPSPPVPAPAAPAVRAARV